MNISYFILGSLIINIFMLVSFFQYVVLEHFNLILFFFPIPVSLCWIFPWAYATTIEPYSSLDRDRKFW